MTDTSAPQHHEAENKDKKIGYYLLGKFFLLSRENNRWGDFW